MRARAARCRWACLAWLAIASGCGRLGFDSIAPADGAPADGTIDRPTLVFGAPQLVVLPGAGGKTHPSLRRDQLELFYSYNDDIWVATRATTDAAWGNVAEVTVLNSGGSDHGVTLTADGLSLYLGRLGTSQTMWVAQRSTWTTAWSTPVEETQLASLDHGAVVENDLTMVAARGDIVRVTRPSIGGAWSAPMALASGLLTGSDPWIDDSLRALVYESNNGTGADLYGALRDDPNGPFTSTFLLSVSTAESESAAWLSPDGKTLYFAREGNIYVATQEP